MTTHHTADAKPWHYHSGVTCCGTCNGHGMVASHHRPTINDPYPEKPCPDCDGREAYPACPVCRCDVEAKGFDCIVCETVKDLTPAQMNAVNPADLADAFAQAIATALSSYAIERGICE